MPERRRLELDLRLPFGDAVGEELHDPGKRGAGRPLGGAHPLELDGVLGPPHSAQLQAQPLGQLIAAADGHAGRGHAEPHRSLRAVAGAAATPADRRRSASPTAAR